MILLWVYHILIIIWKNTYLFLLMMVSLQRVEEDMKTSGPKNRYESQIFTWLLFF